jgi:hypothetical protein
MQTYTVHEPPNPPADRIDRADRLVFVKDGFSWAAALFGPFWLLVHRMWWPLLGWVALAGSFQLLKQATALDQRWIGLAGFALNLLVGLEGESLRRWTLARRGWRTLGAVTGKTLPECERRFFDGWLASQPILAPSGSQPRVPVAGNPFRRAWGALRGARA